ncbi:LssY C-terminal domain-containing protein [Wolbachia endosymbiont of Tetranychus urticae]|uniref:LssY C-terminal domain-containing protein n=1 Tax=Wolbachia endosymbiont of Tetranychus urticae TaxID=169184 RepID=UPI0039789EAE
MFRLFCCYIVTIILLSCFPLQSWTSNIEHYSISQISTRTMKNSKNAGDPINIIIAGTKEIIHKTFTNAGWNIADKLTLPKKIRIALDCIFNLSYRKAPISKLYYLNRPQDISYQLQYEGSPRKRHHVRFWRMPGYSKEVWVGAASFDEKVKFNRVTKKFTHKISPHVDNERDLIVEIFQKYGFKLIVIDKFHAELNGVNGEGDRYYTDGKLSLLEYDVQNRIQKKCTYLPYLFREVEK